MSGLVFKDITIKLDGQDESFLTDIAHLILELNQNGRVVDKTNLLSRESMPGVWDADEPLILRDAMGEFALSVSMQFDENDRQLVGSRELDGPELYGLVGTEYGIMTEIALQSHDNYPDIVLRTNISTIAKLRELTSGAIQQSSKSSEDDIVEKLFLEGFAAIQDFERHGKPESLEQAISKFEAAAGMAPKDHKRLPGIIGNLGGLFIRRFEQLGRLEDINKSIELLELLVAVTADSNPAKPRYLSNLGSSLVRRFNRVENVADIDGAIGQQRAAISLTPDGHPDKPGRLNNLGVSLRTRFDRFGDISDLDSAIDQQRAAIELTPDGHPHKPGHLTNLGNSLITRFERFGKIADLDDGISQQRASVDLLPDDHFDKPGSLATLGNSLRIRFERFGKVADIEESISQQRAAVDLTPNGRPDKPGRLSNLGASLRTRFERSGKIADIDDAISQQRIAVDITPDDHPNKALHLINLGSTLLMRFERLGDIADLGDAIGQQRVAVDLIPNGNPHKASCLTDLGNSLRTRFQQLEEIADADSAVTYQRAALDLNPDDHPEKARHLTNLGDTFMARFLRLHDDEDAKAAILCFSASAQSSTGTPTIRYRSVRGWISMASLIGHESLLNAYECALGLMPLVAWLGLPIPDRHKHLAQIGGISRDAAATAISLEQYDKALEWLEQGRSIVWNQILQLRTPIDELRTANPDLADRLLHVSRLLDRGVEHEGSMGSIEDEERRYRALTGEWESIIEQVRSLPGLQDFLKPPRLPQLVEACQNGPVVVFNIAKERCDALALVSGFDEVMHIPLPDITSERVTELRDQFKDMLYSSGMRMRGERAAKRVGGDEIKDCKPILAELWNGLVKPVLDSLAFSPHPDVLPRIWWCATGPLAFLPIHAAGIYDDQSTDSHTSDYVISSYTPTLSSLLQSAASATEFQFKLLSVIQPSAPGVSSIPNTKEELEYIKKYLGDREHIILEGHHGTKERVTKAMMNSNWVHLACHGSQRQDEPTKSGLILEDGHLTLEEIIKLDLPKAEFAFLSACQTTTGEESLSDEAVHIAGGMLLAGYRGVVATMWSIQDDLAPEVANEFYQYIIGDEGRPDSRKAAEALHYSIQRLRKRGGIPLISWIPFVHLGV